MRNEYDTLEENHTWTLVPRPSDKKVLSNRWIFKTKRNQDGEIEKYKTRLVARGNMQEQGLSGDLRSGCKVRSDTSVVGCVGEQ